MTTSSAVLVLDFSSRFLGDETQWTVADYADFVVQRFSRYRPSVKNNLRRILLHAPGLVSFLEDPRGCWFQSILGGTIGFAVKAEVVWSESREVRDDIAQTDWFLKLGETKLVSISIGDAVGAS